MRWPYADLSMKAKVAGGPEKFVEKLLDNGRCIGRKEMYPWVAVAFIAGAGVTEAIQIGIRLYRDHKNKIDKEVENAKQKALEEMAEMEGNNGNI
mgnify:CR=1 FL=1